jgi:hypothetical protein
VESCCAPIKFRAVQEPIEMLTMSHQNRRTFLLARQGYKRVITIDFEHDTPALQEDMSKNIAFIEHQAKRLLTR